MKRRKKKPLTASQRVRLALLKGKLRMRRLNMQVGKTKMKLGRHEPW